MQKFSILVSEFIGIMIHVHRNECGFREMTCHSLMRMKLLIPT